ncbi:MAG: hypothetical protein WCJ92_05570 [Alphaproteobacteria bacterium]
MKTIQKLTLGLLTVAAFSTSASAASVSTAVEIDFTNGAELASAVTGAVKFNGAGSINFSGSASGDAEVVSGNVKIAANNAPHFIMNGGSLEITAAVNLGNMIMTQPANITLGGNCSFSAMSTGKATVSAASALDLTLVAVPGNLDYSAGKTILNAASVLGGSYALGKVQIAADTATAGHFGTVAASDDVDASACSVADGSFTALSILNTKKLNIADKIFSQDITVVA